MRFYANPRCTTEYPNGAIGFAPGGPMDSLGPYAKVENCPVMIGDTEVARLTCYATGYADTWFSTPACTRKRGKYVRGYFTFEGQDVIFRVMDSHKHLFS